MDSNRIFRIAGSAIVTLALVVSIAGFTKTFGIEKRLNAIVDPIKAEGLKDIAAEAKRLSGADATFEDILDLAKRGGKVTTFAIFYNDMWRETDPNPYSLIVEFDDDLRLNINNQKSFATTYAKLQDTLLALHRIEE